MAHKPKAAIHPVWWALGLFATIIALVLASLAMFFGTFKMFVPVTLLSDRAGLVMESGAKVKMRGVEVGRVREIRGEDNSVRLRLEIYPDQVQFIPANVGARIRATTAFGAKYVDLLYPPNPSARRIAAGAVLQSQNVSIEVNTVFQNLTDLLHQIDPAKLNSVLGAVAEGLRGHASAIAEATTDANHVLLALNSRGDSLHQDWRSLKGFSDTYSGAAHNILSILDAASTTSASITASAGPLDHLLVAVAGFSRSGTALLASSKDALVTGINASEPTTDLLMKYNPELTCMLVGAKTVLDPESEGGYGYADNVAGRNGNSDILDIALLLGDDMYRYPDNLPIVAAKGGPGGKPGCGSLPDVSQNFPQRYLVTNTGWGTGLDVRPNPGIGFPGYANYFPVTRAVPEPPSIRNPGGPAPGAVPYPGAPPYGAPMYGADGTPLYPGEPPAPPPGAPRDPGPATGAEPFVVGDPMQQQPTPAPPVPTPATPSG